MRIAYLSQSDIQSRRANTVHVLKMCNALSKIGHNVTLYGIGDPDHFDACLLNYGIESNFRAKLWRLPSIPGNTIVLAMLSYLDIAFRNKYELIYGRAVFSIFLSSFLNIPFVYESHAPPRTYLHRLAERSILKKNNCISLVCISKKLKDWYRGSSNNQNIRNIIVAPDAADPIRPYSSHNQSATSNNPHAIKIGYAGSFHPGKGADFVIQLAREIQSAEFHLIGGPKESESRIANKTRIPDNVHLHGYLPHASIQSHLQQFDILLAPYKFTVLPASGNFDIASWMSPLKIFEYMSTGIPIIASDLPVLREVLEHERNCLLCMPEDIDQWVFAINKLINNPALGKRLSRNAKNDFEQSYTWDSRVQQLLATLEKHI